MGEKRLIERLVSRSDLQENRESKEILTDSVINYLSRLLNTRWGTVLIDPEYGLPDFSELPGNFASPETEAVRQLICNTIEKYEPRLKNVEVIFKGSSDDNFSICFGISGTIVQQEQRIPLRLLTRLSPGHNVSIENDFP